jgi:hypothetical protein
MNYSSLAAIGIRLIAIQWLLASFFLILRLPSEFILFHRTTPELFSFFSDLLMPILELAVGTLFLFFSVRFGRLIAKGLN